MEGNQVVVLRAGKPPAHGTWDLPSKDFTASAPPADAINLEQRALANSLLPALLYREQRYHVAPGN